MPSDKSNQRLLVAGAVFFYPPLFPFLCHFASCPFDGKDFLETLFEILTNHLEAAAAVPAGVVEMKEWYWREMSSNTPQKREAHCDGMRFVIPCSSDSY